MKVWVASRISTESTVVCCCYGCCFQRCGLHSELLYADDLVIMAPTMEQLGRRVVDWRASLLGKGLKVNAGKSKVMVGSSGGKMVVNSGKWHTVVYVGKEYRQTLFSALYVKNGFTNDAVVCVVTCRR